MVILPIQTNFGHIMENYDVIVIGAGHAGCEAALAAARVGNGKTLLITINMDHIAQMSCNPAIGGIAKGQVVREIDALGGYQGIVTDAASIQFRMLNRAKGPAVWSPRSQCDKSCYQRGMKFALEQCPNLDVIQAEVTDVIMKDNEAVGVITNFKDEIFAKCFVFTTGTFLHGKLHYGSNNFSGGRAGDPASNLLSDALKKRLNIRLGRLKTGTPPRILAKTIDFDKMQRQDTDISEENFSYYQNITPLPLPLPQALRKDMPCYMVYSTAETNKVVKKNIHKAPLYQGKIEGIGTRYCPSFEDKVVRFEHHPKHLLFLEPEGEFTEEYYINGISTSLPVDVQIQMLRTIPGLENAVLSRYAYAIEYDFVFPDQLNRSLAVKKHLNIFTAGQINGTSGYEEAAGQGLIAGMNAAKHAAGKETVELSRDSSYIGVMIDDLVSKDITEPYRLFTSRAEYRLRLRQDNADLRLSEFAYQNGLLSDEKYHTYTAYRDKFETVEKILRNNKFKGKTLWELLKQLRGHFEKDTTLPFDTELLELNINSMQGRKIVRQAAIKAHYEGYLNREESSIAKLQKLESWKIPNNFNYDKITGLRNEAKLKLKQIEPTTLAQAGRIDGVTPAELALLQVHLTRLRNSNK